MLNDELLEGIPDSQYKSIQYHYNDETLPWRTKFSCIHLEIKITPHDTSEHAQNGQMFLVLGWSEFTDQEL